MRTLQRERKFCASSWLLALLLLGIPLAACDGNPARPAPADTVHNNGDITETDAFIVDEAGITARLNGAMLDVEIPLHAKISGDVPLLGNLSLLTLDGDSMGTGEGTLNLNGDGRMTFTVPTSNANLGGGDSMGFVLRWQIHSTRGWLANGRRSLYGALDHDQIFLLSSDTLFAGSRANVRLIAQDADTHEVLALRPAVITLTDGTTELRAEGVTDEVGTLALPMDIPESAEGQWTLTASVDTRTGPVQMQASVTMRRESRVLLTTDKPFYQPGQTIHVRVLAMRRPALIPEAGEPVTIEIQDPKGNKLARQVDTTDEFGVAYTQLKLAREVTFGTYRIFATVGDTTSERAVTVERYALPKFKVALETEQPFYRPGDHLHGTVRSGYFFGKPVAGGQVTVTAWKFDIGFESFAELMGTLDADGNWDFDLDLPAFFVGQPLEQGDALVRLDIAVTDGAGHTQTLTRTVSITNRELLVQVVPATDIVPGVSLDLFVLVADPTGRPLQSSGTATPEGGEAVAFQTDARGIGKVILPANAVTGRQMTGQISIDRGEDPAIVEPFTVGYGIADDHSISIRADQALYEAGDTATLDIHASPTILRVFLDVLKDNQIVLSTAADVDGGVAKIDIDLPGDLVGNLQFEAYAVAPDGNIIRTHSLVFVQAATDLLLTITPAQEEYKPGELATLDIDVRDAEGDGVVSSVGMMIVDEAVFALSDFRPGMEKVYFQLEQEILEPRYEIHNHSAEEVLRNDPSVTDEDRDEIAELVFASSAGMSAYGVNLDSFSVAQQTATTVATQAQVEDATAFLAAARTATDAATDIEQALDAWLAGQQGHWLDPWGQPYRIEREYYQFILKGNGPDERGNTADDFNYTVDIDWFWQNNGGGNNGTNNGCCWNNDEWNGAGNNATNNGANNPTGNNGNNGNTDAPRVRSYFPETLYVNPSVITDADGHGQVEVAMADSITTWRVTATASSQDGGLGSFLGGVRVFQPFFVDINFPATLTAADEVTVPVALYNYLETEQTVQLAVDDTGDDWYELLDGGTRTVTLAPGEVKGDRFTVRVTKPGWHDFQITALGDVLSDAVRRRVLVVPDGQPQLIDVSSRLSGDGTTEVNFPPEAIDGALSLQVKVYPGVLAQAIEGLDSLLRMPSGCFEQTSSTTYPNILVLQYLRLVEQANPEVELKALEYINLGYQRLLTFEVPGGGFEWFGQTPAHRILTAYGLLEFTDMSQVAYVDPAILTRTQAWLLSQQESDGRWKSAPEGIHEGATNNFTDSDLRATAYIAYALQASGTESGAVDSALTWIRANTTGVDDPYSLALAASALLINNPSDATGQALAARLDGLKQSDEAAGTVWWDSASNSFTYGSGSAMTIETTVWSLFALYHAGGYVGVLDRGTTWLIGAKDGFGNWENTQATILTLRFLLTTAGSGPQEADANVAVFHDDVLAQRFAITTESSDILRQIDLNDVAHAGANQVRVEFAGTGNFMLQITGTYYRPWSEVPTEPTGPLAISVEYDKTQLATDELVTSTVTVTNTTEARVDMILVDLGIPPGFDVVLDDFAEYTGEDGRIQKVETTGRQVLVYLYGLDGGASFTFSYRLKAGEPMRAQSPASAAYLYYESDQRAESQPEMFVVTEE